MVVYPHKLALRLIWIMRFLVGTFVIIHFEEKERFLYLIEKSKSQ